MIEVVLKVLILVKRFVPINKKYSYLNMKDVISLSLTNLKINNMLNEYYNYRLSNEYYFTKQFKITNPISAFDKLNENKIPAKILNLIDINEELTCENSFVKIINFNSNFLIRYDFLEKIDIFYHSIELNSKPWIYNDKYYYQKGNGSIYYSRNDSEFKNILLKNGWYFISTKKLYDLIEKNNIISLFKENKEIYKIIDLFSNIKKRYRNLKIKEEINIKLFPKRYRGEFIDEIKDNKLTFKFIKNLMKFVDKKRTYKNLKDVLQIYKASIGFNINL